MISRLVDRLAFTSDNELNGRAAHFSARGRGLTSSPCAPPGATERCEIPPRTTVLLDRDWIVNLFLRRFFGPRNFRLTSSRSKGPDLSTLPGESRLPDAAQAMAHVWNDKYGRFYDRTYRVMYDAGINETGGRTGNTSHVSCGVDVV